MIAAGLVLISLASVIVMFGVTLVQQRRIDQLEDELRSLLYMRLRKEGTSL